MKECKYCGTIYEDSQKTCPNCGGSAIVTEAEKKAAELHQQREEQRRQEAFDGAKDKGGLNKIGIFAAIAVVLVIALVIILPNLGSSGQSSSEDSLSNKESKAAYEQALTYMAAEDYTGAITELDRIDSSYKKYDDVLATREEAVAGYKRQAFASVDQYVAKGDYSNALSVLTTMERIVGFDSEVASKAVEVNKADVMAKVTDYAAQKDYAGAIQYINQRLDTVNNDSNILIKLSEMENAYRNTVETEADAAFKSGGFEKAISVVNAGLDVLPHDGDLEALHDKYMSYRPVYLHDLDKFTSGYKVIYDYFNTKYIGSISVDNDYALAYTSNEVDNKGNSYQHALCGGWDNPYEKRASYTEFDVSSGYSTLYGKFVLSAASRSQDEWVNPQLIIEVDGYEIASYEMNRKDDPIEFELDIAGAEVLTVYLFCEPQLSNPVAYLVDAYVQK